MKVTMAGSLGSGKSISKKVAEKLGMKRYGIGDFRRQMATNRGLTIEELNKIGEKEDWTDREADKHLEKIGKREDNFIIDGRLAWHFVPDSLKIFLKVDPDVGAERIFKAGRGSEKAYGSVEEVKEANECRITSDKKRYQQLYGIDAYDEGNFDVVIDTTNMTEEETEEAVEKAIKSVAGKDI